MGQGVAILSDDTTPRPQPESHRWLAGNIRDPVLLGALAVVALAFVAYLAGLRALYVPLLILVDAAALPVPKLMRSVVGRLVMGLLYVSALVQVAQVAQFFAARSSGFAVAAGITALINAAFLILTPARSRTVREIPRFTSSDAGALLAALIFLVPFAAVVAGHQTTVRIAEIGGQQNVDAISQFMMIGDLLKDQHLTYGMAGVFGGFGDAVHGYGVPLGAYAMLAFLESTFTTSHLALGWHGAELLYFSEYMVSGALLSFVVVKFCHTWLQLLRSDPSTHLIGRLVPVCAGIAVAVPLVVFYELNLVWLGFLVYIYVLTVTTCAFMCIVEFRRPDDEPETVARSLAPQRAVYMIGALVLLYGMAATWPLFVPALGLTLVASLLRAGRLRPPAGLLRSFISPSGIAILGGLLLLLVPVYFQFHYGAGVTGQVNLALDIGAFRYLVLLAAAGLVVLVSSSRWVPLWSRRVTIDVLVPLLIVVSAVALEQLYTLGNATYFAVKTAILPDILTIALGNAVLFAWLWRSALRQPVQLLLLTAVPGIVMLALLGNVPSVLRDSRLLFPGHGQVDFGPTYDADVATFVRLGLDGKLAHYNEVSLHWDANQKAFSTNMELPYWANALTYDASAYDRQASHCFVEVYYTWGTATLDAAEQSMLLSQINGCAELAAQHGVAYYVVTDRASLQYVSRVLRPTVQLAY